jgi:hypothetical protein
MIHFSKGFDFWELKTLFPRSIFLFQSFDGDYLFGCGILCFLNVSEWARAQFL